MLIRPTKPERCTIEDDAVGVTAARAFRLERRSEVGELLEC